MFTLSVAAKLNAVHSPNCLAQRSFAPSRCPKTIDYLSIDTEGSELEILSAFDFSAHHVRIITVEHNHSPIRGKLHDLLTSNGFTRAFEEFSDWDDWYLRQGS
jgi:hypothetical protein